MHDADDITGLLQRTAGGDPQAEQELFEKVYSSLRKIASSHLRKERRDHSLQPTALINEAFILLMRGAEVNFNSRQHFYAVAAHQMRRILIDHARKRSATKRAGDLQKVNLEKAQVFTMDNPDFVILLDTALTRLAAKSARACRVVELHVFAGLTLEETGEATGVCMRTAKRDWETAQKWLLREIYGEAKQASSTGS